MELATVLLWILAVLLVVVGLAGAILPAIPGVPLVFGGLWLAAWIEHYSHVGVITLVILGVLTVIAMSVDWIASSMGAKKVGASPQAISGAALGTFVGAFFALPGLIFGPFIGAVIGEVVARGSFEQAARVGMATWMGLLFGTLAKLALSLTMLGVFAVSYFLQ
jgi:uncharacterized protein YqgC (DUF456 family)